MNKQKLELTWIGKDKRPKLEPRILLEDPALSYHARQRVSEGDLFDNRLIFGDNLMALKALEQELTGKVKCCFIDPPYNTGSAFTHYDDGLEHSIWLSQMRDRLEAIRRLLSKDGSLWIAIDDNECCTVFRGVNADGATARRPKLTVKKIPKVALARCEGGRDEYNLNVQNLPMAAPEDDSAPEKARQGSLFDGYAT